MVQAEVDNKRVDMGLEKVDRKGRCMCHQGMDFVVAVDDVTELEHWFQVPLGD
jgi:hypothetical protein